LKQLLPDVLEQCNTHTDHHNVTLTHLLNQRSGIKDYWNHKPFVKAFEKDTSKTWKPLDLLSFVLPIPPSFSPGAKHEYTDTNYVLLALIIEKITAKPLHTIFRELIFLPLEMERSYMNYSESQPVGITLAHRYEGNEDITGVPRQSADWGGGGTVSSAHELTKFLKGLTSGNLITQHSLNLMKNWTAGEDEDEYYGLGLMMIDMHEKGQLWGHDGWCNSFMLVWEQTNANSAPVTKALFTGTFNQLSSKSSWFPVIKKAVAFVSQIQF